MVPEGENKVRARIGASAGVGSVSYTHLARIKFLQCFGQQVGTSMPESMFALFVFPDVYKRQVMQHEFDHLDGKMFIDHLSALRKQMIMTTTSS